MYEARCAADALTGRDVQSWNLGTGLENGETKKRARAETVKYAVLDVGTYEVRCLLETAEESVRSEKGAKRLEGQARLLF